MNWQSPAYRVNSMQILISRELSMRSISISRYVLFPRTFLIGCFVVSVYVPVVSRRILAYLDPDPFAALVDMVAS